MPEGPLRGHSFHHSTMESSLAPSAIASSPNAKTGSRAAEGLYLQGSLREHLAKAKPLLAECGGMLCLLDSLADAEGQVHPMAGLMPGQARMQKRLAALGLQALDWPEGPLRGHSFHHSTMETPLAPTAIASNPNAKTGSRAAEGLYIQGSLRASYVHHYFPSNPEAVARFFSVGEPR